MMQISIPPPSTLRKRILCIEDDEDTCLLLTELLSYAGYEVVSAQTAAEGVKLAQSNGFALYLLDNWLPDGSEVDACKLIRSFDSNTPIIFYSAAVYDLDRQQALEAGAQVYLGKPVAIDLLLQTIEHQVKQQPN